MDLAWRFASLLTLAAVCAACGGDGSGKQTSDATSTIQSGIKSTNFCGYQVAGGLLGFHKVGGSWIVPSVPSSGADSASSTWTGIGGACSDPPACTVVEPTLIQAGTEQDRSGGQAVYYAWWEALPGPSIQASGGPLGTQSFDVEPGDRITVSVDGSSLVVWNIDIADERGGGNHWTFHTTVPYVAAGTTAEWIAEAPLSIGTSGTGQLPLTDFGRVSFFGLTQNGTSPRLAEAGTAFILDDAQGNVACNPSAPAGSDDAFTACSGAAPCS
ncbi:MAG TPA: G1 family glutamic endopeptidase [Candidatus Binatia bacterium]|nr:G1 family glutamic endopeptidase [Candidatus Binatia bacterium]